MNSFVDTILVIFVILNFVILSMSRIRLLIMLVAAQGVLLGVAILFLHGVPSYRIALFAVISSLIKGVIFPRMLFKAIRDAAIAREIRPHIGFIGSLLCGAVVTAAALLLAGSLPLATEHAESFVVPASLSTVFVGFLMMSTRLTAITQTLGFLMLENGIFIFGLTLLGAMPLLVEIGVLLDLFVLIFVMGIIIYRINQEFVSADADELSLLKD